MARLRKTVFWATRATARQPARKAPRAAIAAHKKNPRVTAVTDSVANKRTVLGMKHPANLLSASVGRF